MMVAIAAVSGAAHAQFVVNVWHDAPALDPAAGPFADTVTPGQITLRSAIQHINTLPPGSYTIDVPLSGGHIILATAGHGEDHAATGDLDIRRDIEIRGMGAGVTGIDAIVLGDRIFDVREPVQFTIRDVTLVNGTAVPGAAGNEGGGAIRSVPGSTVELIGVELRDNSASGGVGANGGAIDAGGTLLITGPSRFANNAASGLGGAIHLAGVGSVVDTVFVDNQSDRDGGAIRTTTASPDLRVIGSLFLDNSSDSSGGAMSLRSPARIDGCTFEFNESVGVGGAITTASTLVVLDSDFRGNFSNSGGGALGVAALGDAQITRTLMEHNTSATSGGAIANLWNCRIEQSTLAHNMAFGDMPSLLGGGGIYNANTLEVVNSTISQNMAPNGLGGGILNASGGDATLIHATVHENHAVSGMTVHNGTTPGGAAMRMTHTVLSGPPAGPFGHISGGSLPLQSLGYNFDSDGSGGLAGPGDIGGTIMMPQHPQLGPLGFHGGPTPTHRAQLCSPISHAGNPVFSVDLAGNQILVDQRGFVRPIGNPDIGATELCVADFNNDGVIDFFDVVEYLDAYNNGEARTDMNCDGLLNFFDLVEFLTYFTSGC
ncbi:MAG: hypothetical protein LAT64_05180 [Phycisphaerales bacterium]|nr:hypothetical protein [Planctomycetota bacterium]MCH8508149.1 hypothetical protein [Phycisphaerales bacterium]